jgi:hypothetical protein
LEAGATSSRVLEADDADRQLAAAYANRAHRHLRTFELDEAVAWGERARALAERARRCETAIHGETTVRVARLIEEEPTAAAALEVAYRRAIAHGNVEGAFRALTPIRSRRRPPDRLVESRMPGNWRVRFGGAAPGNGPGKLGHRAPGRP